MAGPTSLRSRGRTWNEPVQTEIDFLEGRRILKKKRHCTQSILWSCIELGYDDVSLIIDAALRENCMLLLVVPRGDNYFEAG